MLGTKASISLATRSDPAVSRTGGVGIWARPRPRKACCGSRGRSAICLGLVTRAHGQRFKPDSIAFWVVGQLTSAMALVPRLIRLLIGMSSTECSLFFADDIMRQAEALN